MRLVLPDRVLRDDLVWGFRNGFDDEAYLCSKSSPRWTERFGDADHPIPDGRRLDEIVRDLCREAGVCQPFVWAKLAGETSFLTAPVPPGKGYKAPLGFDCPDGGRDPRPEFCGVVPNLRGAVNWWGTFRPKWEWERRLRDGVEQVNVLPEGEGVQFETVHVRTAAEVAYLKYTPHLYSLHDFLMILDREFPSLLAEGGTAVGRFVEPIRVPSRWDHARNVIEADTHALGEWLGKDPGGLPDYEHIRVALEHMGLQATYSLSHLHSAADPRIYVVTK